MTNEITGKTLSSQLEDKWEQVEQALKEFEIRLGFQTSPSEVLKYLSPTPAELNKMSLEDCLEGALLLSQEATHIQSHLNVLKSKMEWCERRINKIIAPIIKTQLQRYMENELKRAMAIRSDDVAEKLQRIYNEASSYHTRLSFIPMRLSTQSDKLVKYSEVKRTQSYG
jgi:hypothetical protein